MIQDIITYGFVFGAAFYTLTGLYKFLAPRKSTDGCHYGCEGCELKNLPHKKKAFQRLKV